MGFLMAAIYDRFMAETERACLAEWREALLRDAEGDVLEIGAGTGANLEHYPSRGVRSLTLTEPDPFMRSRLVRKHGRSPSPAIRNATTSAASATELPFQDQSFDTVVSTLVLCSVPNLQQTLAEVHRVLRPGGQLLFLEHVAAKHNRTRAAMQRLLEPAWKQVAGGCHLTRDTERAIERAGLLPIEPTRESMRRALPVIRPTVRGRAVRPRAEA